MFPSQFKIPAQNNKRKQFRIGNSDTVSCTDYNTVKTYFFTWNVSLRFDKEMVMGAGEVRLFPSLESYLSNSSVIVQ